MGRFKEGKKVADQLLKESKEVGNHLRELDALINTIWALGSLGKLDEGFQLTRRGEKLLNILAQTHPPGLKGRQAAFLHCKGYLLWYKGELDQALNFLETSLALREEVGDKNGIAESLWEIGRIYFSKYELDRVLEYGQKSLALSQAIGDRQGLARSHWLLGSYYHFKKELDQAREYLQKSLALSEAIGDQLGLAWSLWTIGFINFSRVELAQALEYYQKSLDIFETIGFQLGIIRSHTAIGIIYDYKGELNLALEHEQKSMAISETIGNQRSVATSLNNIGCHYGKLGDFPAATEYFERSLTISRKIGIYTLMADSLYQQIRYFVNDLPPETVRSYLAEVKEINERHKGDPWINQRYRLAEAIVLKARGRLVDKTTAQTIFQQIAAEDIVWLELTVEALINLSELLLFELKTLGNDLALNDLKQVIQRLATIAKNQNSSWLLAESFLLRAKLALLDLDVGQAEHLLTQGELVAVEKGLLKLARTIAVEQEILRTQADNWKRIIDQKPSTSEMIELTQFNTLLERMIHKRLYRTEEEIHAYAKKAQQLIEVWEKEV